MTAAQQREYHTLILAALLHDIGKLLNKPKPDPGKKHAAYSEEFLRQPEISALLQQKFAAKIDFELLCYLVLRHDPHLETDWRLPRGDKLLRLIRAADGYSAGERDLSPLYGQSASGELPLDSIFTRRYLGRPLGQARPFYRPAALSPALAFPSAELTSLTGDDYRPVKQAFEQGFRYALAQADTWTELEAWSYSLLERYTWAVPSALHREPRVVSLFDHSRTSCAIAAALFLYRFAGLAKQRPQFLLIKGDVSGVQDYIYSVANVGPGGVAKRLRARSFFITALTEVVAHRLRDELVGGYALPIAATIFSGGGQFVLLAPNLEGVHQNLARLEQEINTWLWQDFQGDLAFVFGCEAVSGPELAVKAKTGRRDQTGRTINQALADLDRQVEQAKEQRLSTLLKREGAWQPEAFQWAPPGQNYEHGACPSCDRLPARAGPEEPDVDQRLCRRCYHDRLLSERIVKARYVAYWRGELPQRSGQIPEKRRLLTFFSGDARRYVLLLDNLDGLVDFAEPPYQLDGFGYAAPGPTDPPLVRHFASYVPHFDSLAALADFCTVERSCVYGRYTDDDTCGILVRPDPVQSRVRAQDYPILQNFGCLAAAAAEKKDTLGAQLLGVLRADVDNLRLLFSDSFEEEIRLARDLEPERSPVRSLSRLATLSRMMDLFFSGWVHETLADPNKPYNRIYTVYAGGDDLCLVGPWDVLIDFARYMAKEFERYTAGNPNVSLSAAISVSKPKFPLATSARRAGELLKQAKNAGRNRLNLFGVIARWRELPAYENLAEDLKDQLDEREVQANLPIGQLWPWAERLDAELAYYLAEKKAQRRYPLSPAFIHRLLRYAEMARAWEHSEVIKADDMLYLARLAYDLGRNIVKSGLVSKPMTENLVELTQLQQRRLMAGMRLPLTYALYRNRERSSDNDR